MRTSNQAPAVSAQQFGEVRLPFFRSTSLPTAVGEAPRWAINQVRLLGFAVALVLLPATTFAGDGVVLLHGLCRSPASMKKIESSLVDVGYIVENVGYDSRSHSIEELSDQAIGEALKSPRLRECPKIHFVTHSLGGILVRSYFKRHPHDRLGRVVMLAPPNQGSEVVDRIGDWYLFRKINGQAGCELGTDAQSTPNRLGPVEFECGVIAGDRTINWINSCMIPGRDDGKVSVERSRVEGMKDHRVVHVTHPYIMKNATVIELTLRFIREGTFGQGQLNQTQKRIGLRRCGFMALGFHGFTSLFDTGFPADFSASSSTN